MAVMLITTLMTMVAWHWCSMMIINHKLITMTFSFSSKAQILCQSLRLHHQMVRYCVVVPSMLSTLSQNTFFQMIVTAPPRIVQCYQIRDTIVQSWEGMLVCGGRKGENFNSQKNVSHYPCLKCSKITKDVKICQCLKCENRQTCENLKCENRHFCSFSALRSQ